MKFESFLFESEIDTVKKELESTDQYLKAPNGKKTNLTARQWLIVRTKSFKKWFGDWEHDPKSASKVLDENNEPLVAYHGTNATFTKFEIDKTGSYGHDFGKLIFFTDNSAVASAYSIRFNKNKEYLDKKEMIDNLMSKLSNVVKKYGIPSPEFDAVRKEWETTGHALQDEQNAIYNAIERFELITDNATVYAMQLYTRDLSILKNLYSKTAKDKAGCMFTKMHLMNTTNMVDMMVLLLKASKMVLQLDRKYHQLYMPFQSQIK